MVGQVAISHKHIMKNTVIKANLVAQVYSWCPGEKNSLVGQEVFMGEGLKLDLGAKRVIGPGKSKVLSSN